MNIIVSNQPARLHGTAETRKFGNINNITTNY